MRRLAAVVLLLLSFAPALAHRGAPASDGADSVFEVVKLTERAYCLYGQGGNIGFLVTGEGVLVVDDQYEKLARGIIEQIRNVTDQPLRYLVNTHHHGDHVGGNPVFIELADIIAHDDVRQSMLGFPELVNRTFPARIRAMESEIAAIGDPADRYRVSLETDLALFKRWAEEYKDFDRSKVAAPELTYDGHLNLWLGDQEVRVFHVAPGHTGGDSMVWFKTQNVLHMGDLLFEGMVPFIDVTGGGSVAGTIKNLEAALAIVPPDVMVIPGHGKMTDIKGLARMRSFLVDLTAKVETAKRRGASKAEAVRDIRMDEYPDIRPGFRQVGNIIMVIFDEIGS